MISFDEAAAIACAAARPLGPERVPLRAAAGRVLAAVVTARRDSPPFAVSAMDGYAVRDADVAAAPCVLRVAGESFPGGGYPKPLDVGECVRIFTGAPAPEGTERIVIQEVVARQGDRIRIDTAPGGQRFLRARASDFRSGEVLLPAGRRLSPGAMVAAAAADVGEVEAFRRPRLAVLSTGDELAEPGMAGATPGAIPESVSFGVAALAEAWGGEIVQSARLKDDLTVLQVAAAEALEAADIVVVAGGASVGDRDFAKAMFEPFAPDLLFSRAAIKPGKPVWLARVRERLVLGLPGNPTSALVTARLFLAPLLAGLGGLAPEVALAWRSVRSAAPLPAAGDRETFLRGRWRDGAVEPLANQDSSAQKALAEAEALIRRRTGARGVPAGSVVEVLDL
ncbi:MAG TPA: molybdopterin molybdotransferase MoeA [Caulobacteraceae bacterium]